MKEELVFHERQRFNQWWFLLIFISINSLFIAGCIIQLGMGKPWGDKPMSDTMLIIFTISSILFSVSFFFIRLDTVIDNDGVYEQMFPLQLKFKFTPWNNILNTRVKKMRFSGWGIRYDAGGEVMYTIFGKYVLELTLNNNKKISIGTQKPDELMEFLDKLDAERKQK